MDFILADAGMNDVGYIDKHAYLDIDIGVGNDFVLKIDLSRYDSELYSVGHILYCEGTEYGGILNDPEVRTIDNTISFAGDTFRGILSKKYIVPPTGEAYRYISGELNSCIQTLIDEQCDSLFSVSTSDTGIEVSNYKFDRYCDLLYGIEKMLLSVGYNLTIKVVCDSGIKVQLEATPINDYSDEIETSQDSGINFVIKQYTNRYNYMICLGSGELEDRTVVYLHLKDDGTVEKVGSIPSGLDVKVYKYDYAAVESDEELISSGTSKFKDINYENTQKMMVPDDMELKLGDIVGGRDYVTGMQIREAVTQLIIKHQYGQTIVSYTIGDD